MNRLQLCLDAVQLLEQPWVGSRRACAGRLKPAQQGKSRPSRCSDDAGVLGPERDLVARPLSESSQPRSIRRHPAERGGARPQGAELLTQIAVRCRRDLCSPWWM